MRRLLFQLNYYDIVVLFIMLDITADINILYNV